MKKTGGSQDVLLQKTQGGLAKAKTHLECSYAKAVNIDLTKETFSESELEIIESFSCRYARSSDLLIKKYFRLSALRIDPGYTGTVVDLLNLAEKQGWISSAEQWKRIRELRNFAAHEYAVESVLEIYSEFVALTPELLKVCFATPK